MKKITIEDKEKEKEKKIKQLMKLDLKDKFKEIFDKEESNKLTNKVSKSNQDLICVEYDKQFSLNSKNEQTIIPRKIEKHPSNISRSPEHSKNIKSIIDCHPDDALKTKIYRVIGKKINNFSQIFEDKNNLLIDLFQKFKSQILKIRNEFNYHSNSAESNINKLKSNNIKFINFNEVYIFERKVIEYLEKRILFYIKIINNTKSIFLENNINIDILNNFYSLIGKENSNNINKKQDYSLTNNEDNHYNQKAIKEHTVSNNYNNRYNEKYIDFTINGSSQNSLIEQKNLNTERNTRVENKYNKLFLPSLKKLSRNENLLNSSTFRNSQKKHDLESKPKSNKKYDLFNIQKSSFADSIKKIKEENILSLKTSKIHKDDNKIIIEHKKEENINISNKGEDKYIKKDIKDDENINISNKGENEFKKVIKEGIKDDVIDQLKEKEKFRRKSVVLMTVPNYEHIGNINDYIMNYKNNSLNNSKDNIQDNDDDKFEINQKKKKLKHKKNKTPKYKLINKETKKLNSILDNDHNNEDNEKNKKDMKNNLNNLKSQNNNHEDNDNNYKNKEIINDNINLKNDNENNNEYFNSENSSNSDSEEDEDKNSNKSKIMNNNNHIKNDEEEEINENNTSMDNIDPLDDVKYLKKLREKINKEIYGIY